MNAWLEARYAEAKKAYEALMKFYPFGLEDLGGEIWKVVPDYEDYHVSNFGRVKSLKWGKQKILKPTITKQGYLRVILSKDNKVKTFKVYRLVAEAFIPNPDKKPEVDHVYGMKFDNSVWNLRWATSAENVKYAYETGVKKSGEEHFRAKFTSEQVEYIRENPEDLTLEQLAERLGSSPTAVSYVQLGKTYKSTGGKIRRLKFQRISDALREEIRRLYVRGSSEFGTYGLAKKFGVAQVTIRRIINGK